jgi:hypothetical protein
MSRSFLGASSIYSSSKKRLMRRLLVVDSSFRWSIVPLEASALQMLLRDSNSNVIIHSDVQIRYLKMKGCFLTKNFTKTRAVPAPYFLWLKVRRWRLFPFVHQHL